MVGGSDPKATETVTLPDHALCHSKAGNVCGGRLSYIATPPRTRRHFSNSERKMVSRALAAVIGILLAGTAHAASITEVVVKGRGVVTLSIPGTVGGVPISPEVGTPVDVTANVFFGSGVVPIDSNGTFVCCGNLSILEIKVSLSGVGNFSSRDEYDGSTVDFTNGKLFQFALGAPFSGYDGGGDLTPTDFQYSRSITPICDPSGYCLDSSLVLGSWTVSDIDIRIDAVPEPEQWALMLAGFGFVGTCLRARPAKSVMAIG